MSAKKEGLDYFPFSVDLLEDETLDILREDYGVVVNDVYISLLCLLYKKKGYYVPYETEKEKKDCVWFIYKRVRGGRYPVQQNSIPKVIESLVSQGLFSGRYFPKIITSERAQRTYYSATVDRKADSLNIKPEYWLLSIEDMEKLSKKHPYYLSCTQISKSDETQFKSDDLTTKESKVKESKYNNTHIPPISPKGEWEDYKTFIEMVKNACPIIYNRHAKLVNVKTKISVAGEVNKALDEILQVYSIEELRELFEKLNQTYLVKPKYQNIDIAWVLNNIPKINQAIKEVEENKNENPLYEVDEDGVVIGSVEEKTHNTKHFKQSKQEYMKSENERIMGVLGRLWQEAKEEEERAQNGKE